MKDYEAIHRELINRIELLRDEIEEYGEDDVLLCHYRRGKSLPVLRHVTLRIDNSQHRADEVVRRVAEYADCLTEEVSRIEDYWSEAHFNTFFEFMDRFIFVIDGERSDFNVREVAQGDVFLDTYIYNRKRLSAKELGERRAQWAAVLERLRHGKRLEVEHIYTSEQGLRVITVDGLPALLSDLLEGGRLADCVTMLLVEDTNDPIAPEERYVEDIERPRYLWINGMLRGEYVCGEAPFVRDDSLIRSIGSWRQSSDPSATVMNDGVMLYFALNTPPALLARAKACALKLKSELGAQLEYLLSKDDDYCEGGTPRHEPTNEQAVRLWLEHFGRIRAHFTQEEARQMLACAIHVQELLTRHGEGKYAPEEIELYRFGVSVWTLLDVQKTLQRNTRREPAPAGLRLEWPEALQRKVAALPEDLRRGSGSGGVGQGVSLVGMGDLSWAEGASVMGIYSNGLYIMISDIRLNGLDDMRRAEELFNELVDILREARERDHERPLPELPVEEWDLHCPLHSALSDNGVTSVYCETLPDGDLKSTLTRDAAFSGGKKIVTDRECLAFLQSAERDWVNTSCIDPQEITFEAQDISVNARLRFRLEDGRFIHEVAVLE